MRNDRENMIVDKTFSFALQIIEYTEKLRELKKFEMGSQLFRSGTSIGANSREAKMGKVRWILYINSKLRPKKQTKQPIGWSYVRSQSIIPTPQRNL
jgi:hypothetical protein